MEASSSSARDSTKTTAERVAARFGGAVDEGVGPVTAVVDLVGANALGFGEAEVEEEFVGFFKVNMGLVDVGEADETDFLGWRGGRGHGCWMPLKTGRDYKMGKEKFLLLDRIGKRRLGAMGGLLRSVAEDAVVGKTEGNFIQSGYDKL